jgi:hypothetical protein
MGTEAEQDVVSRVKGFIEPIFVGVAPDGKTMNGVGPEDWRMIKEGYACGECLAIFDTYTIRCPVCKTTRDVFADLLPPPQDWLDHLRERENPTEHNQPGTFDEAMTRMQGQEAVPVSKLRKRRG